MVYKANSLVTSGFDISVYEWRILVACIAQIRKDEAIDEARIFTVKATDIAEMAGVSTNNCYGELKKAAERLGDRKVTLNQGMGADARRDEKTRVTWVPAVSYSPSGGLVRLRFAAEIIPYISQLTEKFTHYKLTDIMALSTGTAMHLFEILIQWRTTQYVRVPLEQLRFMLGLVGKYPDYRELRKRVIDPAVKEINEHTPIEVEWTPVKDGRTVVAVDFSYQFKDGDAKLIEQDPEPEEKPALAEHPAKLRAAKRRKTTGDPEWLTRDYIKQQALAWRVSIEDAEERIRAEHGLPETPQAVLL
ncbi:replication initiation protein [Pseudomonas sp. JUb52]|uniref:replication initiation protein n=1 Tax=Pseudomonas sp. JUb52 TaxID=2485127 RepID=UPI0014053725|nr:replication initiation protein [Pseudomonas sp. JUb52]